MNKRALILGLSALSLLGAALAQASRSTKSGSSSTATGTPATGTTAGGKTTGASTKGASTKGASTSGAGMNMASVAANTATLAQLEKIPGMTSRFARDVIKARPFKNEADFVKRIKGIGKKNVLKFEKYLKFS